MPWLCQKTWGFVTECHIGLGGVARRGDEAWKNGGEAIKRNEKEEAKV